MGDKIPFLLLQGSDWSSAKLTEPILSGCHCNINTHLEQMWLKAWNIEQTAATDPVPLHKLLCSINGTDWCGQEGRLYSPQFLSRWAGWLLLREVLPRRLDPIPHIKIQNTYSRKKMDLRSDYAVSRNLHICRVVHGYWFLFNSILFNFGFNGVLDSVMFPLFSLSDCLCTHLSMSEESKAQCFILVHFYLPDPVSSECLQVYHGPSHTLVELCGFRLFIRTNWNSTMESKEVKCCRS